MADKTEIVEHICGEFGFTVIYSLDAEYDSHVDFVAVEVIGLRIPNNDRLYEKAGAHSSNDDTDDPRQAARYVSGSVKWDGCSHLNFGNTDGYLHLCGIEHFNKLTAVLPAIYERCGELMKARGVDLLEGEWPSLDR